MKYRKKPVVIEAVKWCLTNLDEILLFVPENLRIFKQNEGLEGLYIKTLEGLMHVSKGDYIIRGVNGEYYPCKPDIFEKTYEKVAE